MLVGICRGARRLAAALPLIAAAGCTPLHYLAQAGAGQLEMSLSAQSLRDAIADPQTTPRVRSLLLRVRSIQRFGEQRGLARSGSYATYADLHRDAAVWVVSACEPLRFEEKTWSFPIVGSVPYLGWFREARAREFAAGLAREGWDVDVREARAYSTLGWFQDPVLSTMIPEGDEALGELANTLLHESVHATLYVKGQSVFNESVASFVGDRLAESYLEEEVGAESVERRAYLEEERKHDRRARGLQAAYRALERLYASARPAREKLAEKRRILGELERELELKRRVSNATLIQRRTYNAGKGPLAALLGACDGSIARLLAALGQLELDAFSEPQQQDLGPVILPLARAGCR